MLPTHGSPHPSPRLARQLSAALAPLYTTPDADTLFEQLAAALLALFGAETVCFDYFDQQLRGRFLGAWPQHPFPLPVLREAAALLHQHPIFPDLFARRAEPLRVSDRSSVNRFVRTDLY